MNYRHQFHAGNFADIFKHALLVQLIRALQKKEKGILYLDTHAGRGSYDLEAASKGDSLPRAPEWPDGIGRVWRAADRPAELDDLLGVVAEINRRRGAAGDALRFYPGSPLVAAHLARPQDRLALCEKHPAECAVLRTLFDFSPRVSVHEMDGYTALRAMLPPPERRALVLIDPPYEAQDEWALVLAGLGEALERFRSGVFAIWHPLTGRARVDEFMSELTAMDLPPAVAIELSVVGEGSLQKLTGCGLVVVNPPWKFEESAGALIAYLKRALAREPGSDARIRWLVPEQPAAS